MLLSKLSASLLLAASVLAQPAIIVVEVTVNYTNGTTKVYRWAGAEGTMPGIRVPGSKPVEYKIPTSGWWTDSLAQPSGTGWGPYTSTSINMDHVASTTSVRI